MWRMLLPKRCCQSGHRCQLAPGWAAIEVYGWTVHKIATSGRVLFNVTESLKRRYLCQLPAHDGRNVR